MTSCIWSRYIAEVSDVDSMFNFLRDNEISNWKARVASRDFTNEKAVRAHIDDCIAKQFIPWVALFA